MRKTGPRTTVLAFASTDRPDPRNRAARQTGRASAAWQSRDRWPGAASGGETILRRTSRFVAPGSGASAAPAPKTAAIYPELASRVWPARARPQRGRHRFRSRISTLSPWVSSSCKRSSPACNAPASTNRSALLRVMEVSSRMTPSPPKISSARKEPGGFGRSTMKVRERSRGVGDVGALLKSGEQCASPRR
jgi:hypothetical protein